MNAYAVLGGLVFVALALIFPATFGLYSFAQSSVGLANAAVTFQLIDGCTVKTCASLASASPATQTLSTDSNGNVVFVVTGFSWGSGTVSTCPANGSPSPGVVTGPGFRILLPSASGLPTETDVWPFGVFYYIDAQCPNTAAPQTLASNIPTTFAPVTLPAIGVCTNYDSRDNCIDSLNVYVKVCYLSCVVINNVTTTVSGQATTLTQTSTVTSTATGSVYYCTFFASGGYPANSLGCGYTDINTAAGAANALAIQYNKNIDVVLQSNGQVLCVATPTSPCSATVITSTQTSTATSTITNTATVVKTSVITQSGTTTTVTMTTTVTSSGPNLNLNLGIIVGLTIAGIGAVYPEGKKDAPE